jgi:hypothetical protein
MRHVISLILICLGFWGWIWSGWPNAEVSHPLELTPTQMTLDSAAEGTASLRVNQPQKVTLHLPATVRLGESALIRLTIEPRPAQLADPTLPDVSLTHNLLLEARLELPDVTLAASSPDGRVGQTFTPGQPLTYQWEVTPQAAGKLEGTAWLTLYFIPRQDSPEGSRAITAQRFTLKVDSLLGLEVLPVRVIASILLLIACIFQLWPFFKPKSH